MSCWFPERLAVSYSRGNQTFRIIGDRLVHCLRISLGRAADRGHGRRLGCQHVAKRRACSLRIGNVRVIRGKEHRVYRVPNRRSPRETHVLFLTSQGVPPSITRGRALPTRATEVHSIPSKVQKHQVRIDTVESQKVKEGESIAVLVVAFRPI